VFLDFTHNPLLAAEIDYASLSAECRDYLAAAGACFGTPIERLDTMNKPAVDFYRDKGVDLHSQMLEIAVCVQHNNGGLAVDCWWRSNIEGLFPVGEAAGTHGVFRPGGSALNSGQAGSMRAALYIARKRKNISNSMEQLEMPLGEIFAEISSIMADNESGRNIPALITAARERMSMAGGMFRNETLINRALEETKKQLDNFAETVRISSAKDLSLVFRLKDLLICQYVYLSAMADYIRHGGKSRGSALYYHKDGTRPHPALPAECAALLDRGELASMIQEITCKNGTCSPVWRPVRPIPPADDFFENVWRTYRENGNVEVF
jgi:succinate dehydrogenase/fumarate reductase flavoprotein subunit